MPFVKLDCRILDSSIWIEPSDVRVLWITLLAMADANGLVESTCPGISRRACLSLEATKRGIEIFEGPDPDSKNPENEGRRIRRVSGGYLILNYEAYRRKDHTANERVRRFREKRKAATLQQLDSGSPISVKGEKTKCKDRESADSFEAFWTAYPKRVGRGAAERIWKSLKPNVDLVEKILYALKWQLRQDQWLKDGGQFIPHPATWLNQRRWEDEPRPTRPTHSAEPDPRRQPEPEPEKTHEQKWQEDIADLKKRVANSESFLASPVAKDREKQLVQENLAKLRAELARLEGQAQVPTMENKENDTHERS